MSANQAQIQRSPPYLGPFPEIWHAPLAPIAVAFSIGILVDRHLEPNAWMGVGVGLVGLIAWFLATASPRFPRWVWLLIPLAGFGGSYHALRVRTVPVDDIRHFAGHEPLPVRLRGIVVQNLRIIPADELQSLRSFDRPARTVFDLRVLKIHRSSSSEWKSATGQVRVSVQGELDTLNIGNVVEIVGRLRLPEKPANPGERDFTLALRDQGISALVQVPTSEGIDIQEMFAWPGWNGVLEGIRQWGRATLQRFVGEHHLGVAVALLLGDGAGLGTEGWQRYQRTGVVHVLAISGQHLVVLAMLLGFASSLVGVDRRTSVAGIAVFLLTYGIITGGRAAVMRAVWMVLASASAVWLRRPTDPTNLLALAWLGVAFVSPQEIVTPGCQLTFLAVASLFWRIRWEPEIDPLDRLERQTDPWWQRLLRWAMEKARDAYGLNAWVWLWVTPLVAWHFHTVSLVALLVGPPIVLFSSLALVFGFLTLFVGAWFPPFGFLFGGLTTFSLAGCDMLVSFALTLPFHSSYVPDLHWLWLILFYLLVAVPLFIPNLRSLRIRVGLPVACLMLALLTLLIPRLGGEFRCAFLAVGHGNCTVLELPNGKVMLYDAGSLAGPELVRRSVAPYLWHRGIQRIDELFISHADLDHFNGIVALLERFPVAKINWTPTFAQRGSPGVEETLQAVEKRKIPTCVVQAGDAWSEGNVRLEVLHPPAVGPPGNENARSMVLRITVANLHVLLTGDLEGEGLTTLLKQPARKADLLLAPHHGSVKSNVPTLARWTDPAIVVSSQAAPKSPSALDNVFAPNAKVFTTWQSGTVTFSISGNDAWLETHLPPRRVRIPKN